MQKQLNTDPMQVGWLRILSRKLGGFHEMRARMEWLGPKWKEIREIKNPQEVPGMMDWMSSKLGYDAAALILEFDTEQHRLDIARENRRKEQEYKANLKAGNNIDALNKLKEEARLRPRRHR